MENWDPERVIIFCDEERRGKNILTIPIQDKKKIAIFIGPVGGWSADERRELKNLNFNVFLQDERLSSESAKKIMHEQNIKTGKNKEHIDLIASTIILQSFLDKGSF